jgi:hypothetical protein
MVCKAFGDTHIDRFEEKKMWTLFSPMFSFGNPNSVLGYRKFKKIPKSTPLNI